LIKANKTTEVYIVKSCDCNLSSANKHRLVINKGNLVMDNSKSNQEFKTGDTVKLISGGPTMTVESISNYDGDIHCQWFAGKKLESGKFPPDSLVRVSVNETEK